ncbi:MAG: TIGR03960 family B12-binding radical SAM protein [Endomicrobium sp.]|jgi:radical SAM family uncharacterized protein/radical SAM-linked protein|nr:TIGR03960 family B12-binding radical SAM protein [Endomicrobium sp.]
MLINIDRILNSVQKPARYINGEINSYHNNKNDIELSIVLCYPELYEIGASNLGIEILYHLINEKRLARCERVFAPGEDMELMLKQHHIQLFSLESKTPLNKFDIIGFTIQYELVVTNIINILSLSNINIFAKDRKDYEPLVIAGGPALTNPEPFCDFFDLFVLGDGEEVIEDILTMYKNIKYCTRSKRDRLKLLANIAGVYVPSLYKVTYGNSSINSITSICSILNTPKTIIKKRISDLDNIYIPKKKILPFMDIIHNRMIIEIARGCLGKCRFCQASKYYYPWRQRSINAILDIVKSNINMGFENITFSSLSCSDYQEFEELLIRTRQLFLSSHYCWNIALPSLRCNTKVLRILKYVNQHSFKKPTLTLAPEAGTERLRNVIGKYISDSQIIKTILTAHEMGWKVIKLYFMIGLPTETDDDILKIGELLKIIKKQAKTLNFNVTVSPFIPKAQTPFQWVEMNTLEELQRKIILIKKILSPYTKKVRIHNYKASIIEALIARGNRKLSQIIYEAWQQGVRFNHCLDDFSLTVWDKILIKHNINLSLDLYKQRDYNTIFPWDHLFFGVPKEALFKEYQNSCNIRQNSTYNPSFNDHYYNKSIVVVNNMQYHPEEPMMRYQLCFSKIGPIKFISHLDQVTLLRRLARMSGLPIAFTGGFSPKVKSSYGPPLPLGYESCSEYMDIYLTKKISICNFKKSFSKVLPYGMKIIKVQVVPLVFPSINNLINVAEYEIYDRNNVISQEKIINLLKQEVIVVDQIVNDKNIKINIKPIIKYLKKENEILILQVRLINGKFLRPKVILNILGYDDLLFNIKRSNLFIETECGELYTI